MTTSFYSGTLNVFFFLLLPSIVASVWAMLSQLKNWPKKRWTRAKDKDEKVVWVISLHITSHGPINFAKAFSYGTTHFNCQAVINADIYISAGVVGCISFRLKAFMCTDIRTKTDDIVFLILKYSSSTITMCLQLGL